MEPAVGQSQPAAYKPGMPDRRRRKPDAWARVFRYLTVLVYPLLIIYFLVIVSLGDSLQRSKVTQNIDAVSTEAVRSGGGHAILPIMVAGVAVGAIGLILSFKRARRRSDYNYQTQLFLTLLSAGGLVVYFLFR
ncbi:MAG: hypothetical protein EOM72_04460 [Opitutae bacterium]|nr:hypothetical protein [Opitutae bacterium]